MISYVVGDVDGINGETDRRRLQSYEKNRDYVVGLIKKA